MTTPPSDYIEQDITIRVRTPRGWILEDSPIFAGIRYHLVRLSDNSEFVLLVPDLSEFTLILPTLPNPVPVPVHTVYQVYPSNPALKGINVRSAPRTNATITRGLNRGDEVTVITAYQSPPYNGWVFRRIFNEAREEYVAEYNQNTGERLLVLDEAQVVGNPFEEPPIKVLPHFG